jgi:Family of unknown function (DUF5317)
MFMGFMTLVILCSAVALGGSLSRFAKLRLRYPWLIILALLVQILITDFIPGAPREVLVGLHMATYVAAAVVVWANRRLPGLPLIALGTITNAVDIALNGGTLPASRHALAAAGLPTDPRDFTNSGLISHPVLPWLGDIAATPAWLPFRNVISIGDLTILLGAAMLIHAVSRSRLWLTCAYAVRTRGVPKVSAPASRNARSESV